MEVVHGTTRNRPEGPTYCSTCPQRRLDQETPLFNGKLAMSCGISESHFQSSKQWKAQWRLRALCFEAITKYEVHVENRSCRLDMPESSQSTFNGSGATEWRLGCI